MSFFQKIMSQNDWAANWTSDSKFFKRPKKKNSGQPKASPHFRHCGRSEIC